MLAAFAKDRKQFGTWEVARASLWRLLAHFGCGECLHCVTLDTRHQKPVHCDARFTARFLAAEELMAFTNDAVYELTPEFVQEATRAGDQCFAILEGAQLASYGWYSRRPTPISDDLEFVFDPRWVYMYKGFTHPSFRGLRLHAIGMGLALQQLTAQGARGLVSYIEAQNLDSRRSCQRLGYQEFGRIAILGPARHRSIHVPDACGEYGVFVREVTPQRSAEEAHAH